MHDEQLEELTQEVMRLRKENELLRQKIDLLIRRVFGRKSEQLDANQLELLLGGLDKMSSSPASGMAASPEAVTARHKPSSRQPRCPDNSGGNRSYRPRSGDRQQMAGGYVQIDETPVKYLSPGAGQTSQGYFWAVNVPGADTVYHWTSGRGHEHLLEILPENYNGTVQCDGYGAYRTMLKKRPGVELAGCWAHVRRKFHEAFEQKEATGRTGWILWQIVHLYAIERKLRESRAGPKLREAFRAAQSRPILVRLKKLLTALQPKHLPQSLTGKAISYALGQWELLDVYVEKGRIEIDNNLVENAIRPTALGRKNWLFIGAQDAGWRSAVIYSIIQSCRTHGVEPFAYLKDVLTRLPAMTNHQIPAITPKAWAKSTRTPLALAS